MKVTKASEAALKIADLKRPPPAYQTYASDDLSAPMYFRMTLTERGLYDSLLRVQWIGGHVPSDPDEIAELVRRPLKEVHDALASGRVLEQFEELHGDPRRLINVLLREQRERQLLRRELQADGGRRTAAANRAKQAAEQATELPAKYGGKHPSDPAASEKAELRRAEARHIATPISTTTTASSRTREVLST